MRPRCGGSSERTVRDDRNFVACRLETIRGTDAGVGVATRGLAPIGEEDDHRERSRSELARHALQNMLEATRDASEPRGRLACVDGRCDGVEIRSAGARRAEAKDFAHVERRVDANVGARDAGPKEGDHAHLALKARAERRCVPVGLWRIEVGVELCGKSLDVARLRGVDVSHRCTSVHHEEVVDVACAGPVGVRRDGQPRARLVRVARERRGWLGRRRRRRWWRGKRRRGGWR